MDDLQYALLLGFFLLILSMLIRIHNIVLKMFKEKVLSNELNRILSTVSFLELKIKNIHEKSISKEGGRSDAQEEKSIK